ncbi:MAG: family 20 glycosylhydrolase [Bryobacteraceae bacterium]|nr:family 20 glycosylhydrolase [Bryobacteraceae bacterium]
MQSPTYIAFLFAIASAAAADLPVRGLHVMAPSAADVPLAEKFIREALPKEGVNTLVFEVNYEYRYSKRPEVAEPNALTRDDMIRIVSACRDARVRLIPQINCLGHQSWGKTTFALLRAYPEFDETPGKYPDNEGIYCRSYCPLHPKVHEVLFELIDELADLFQADAFHVGMDEVFLLGEDDCPRCRGRNKAELFAGEVRKLRDHLAASNRAMWMWGDRLLDGDATGLGKWEASLNATHPAIDLVPKDIVICDWHYGSAHPTASYFALRGFPVVSSPWRQAGVALRQLDLVRLAREHGSPAVAARMQGMLQTTWTDLGSFAKAYFREPGAEASAVEAAACFRELFRELR